MEDGKTAKVLGAGWTWKLLGSVFLAAVLLFALFQDLNWEDLPVALAEVPAGVIAGSFLCYLTMNVFRSTRLRTVFPSVPIGRLLGIAFVHNFFNVFVPFRVGELSFPILLRRHASFTESITALVVVRILDLIMITLIFVIAALLTSIPSAAFLQYGLAVTTILMAAVVALWVLRDLPLRLFPPQIRPLLEPLRAYRWGRLGWLFLHTVVIWTSSLGVYMLLARPLGVESVSYLALCIPITFVRLTNVLPISGLAGFGTTEGAWVLGMLAIGVDRESALVSGLLIHVLRLVYTLGLGLAGWVLLRVGRGAELE